MVDEACLVIILWAEIPDAMIRFRLFLHGLVMFGPLAGALSHEIELYEAVIDWLETTPKIMIDQAGLQIESDDDLRRRVEEMGPWHHLIELRGGIVTQSGSQNDHTDTPVSAIKPIEGFAKLTRKFLPDGMKGKSFLDCGCNAGGYCFAAKDAGAERTFGFDVRKHWIDQARFIAAHRENPSDNMRFEIADLLDLGEMNEDFDVTWFSGLFYHLPDPVAALKIAADRTREMIFVNTAAHRTEPGEVEKPALVMKMEGTEELMSGVHRLSWLPTGPQTMKNLLSWLGFPESRLIFWYRSFNVGDRRANGRLMIAAARQPGRFDGIDDAEPRDVVKHPLRANADDLKST